MESKSRSNLQDFFQEIEHFRSHKSDLRQIRDIVSIEDWLTEYYIGATIQYLFPYWKEVLIDIFEDPDNYPTELIFSGSLGTGKSTCAELVIFRLLYELTCYSNIPAKFNLPMITEIIFMYLSVTAKQGERTGFGKLRRLIDTSPYMADRFPRNTYIDSEIKFRNNENVAIYAGSDVTHFIGGDLYAIILDEANFLRGAGDKGRFVKATDIYRESTNRRRSRFLIEGKEFGMSIIVSSVDTENSFTEERIKTGRENPKKVRVYHSSLLDVKAENFSKERFFVQYKHPDIDYFILEPKNKTIAQYFYNSLGYSGDEIKEKDYERPKPGTEFNFVPIPVDFYDTFLVDLPNSLKEVAGVVIRKAGKLFNAKARWDKCKNVERTHPFTKQTMEVSTSIERNELIDRFDHSVLKKGEVYFIHIDQSTTNDDTGIAMSHCEFDVLNVLTKVVVDLVLQITAPKVPEAQIDIGKIRDFFLHLKRAYKIKIGWWSYDKFGSEESFQVLKKKNINSARLSLDRDDSVYKTAIQGILKEMVDFYHYVPLEQEFFDLDHDRERRKVEHPIGSDKGVADAFAGSIYNAMIHMAEALKSRNLEADMKVFHEIRNEDVEEQRVAALKGRMLKDSEYLLVDEELSGRFK